MVNSSSDTRGTVNRADRKRAGAAGRAGRRPPRGGRRRPRRDERAAHRPLRLRRRVGERVRRLGDGVRPAGPEPDHDDRDARRHPSHRRGHRPAGRRRLRQRLRRASATWSAPWSSSTAPGWPPSASRTTCSPSGTASTRASRSASWSRPSEQARRLRAAKAAQESERFVLIARVEALIAGHGVDAACERAVAYAEAGADAILIHSKDKSLAEIEGFLEEWRRTGLDAPSSPCRPSSPTTPPTSCGRRASRW